MWRLIKETHFHCLRAAGAKIIGIRKHAPSPAEAREAIRAAHPIGNMAQGDEIADAILFLASDLSRFMTGSEMLVDGGYTAQ